MTIAEKLDFLMNLTSTRNTALAKALSFDPSYISRIRSGSRGIPRDVPFTRPVASFFASRIREEYQFETLSAVILGGGELPSDKKELENTLFNWLKNNSLPQNDTQPLRELLINITNVLDVKANASTDSFDSIDIGSDTKDSGQSIPFSVYFGNQGKREAVLKFLKTLLSSGKPCQLCLFSDEDMSWLSEMPDFAKEWALLLLKLMKSGSKIKIIHTVSRDLNELMDAIKKWVPLYSTGAIEPYYCPRLRDGIYRRSLFIARGHSAVISTSVEDKTDEMANFLIQDPAVVSSLEAEYDNYFALCRPLMKMYTRQNAGAFISALVDRNTTTGQFYLSHPMPSIWSLPPKLIESFATRENNPEAGQILLKMRARMLDILKNGGRITEILYPYDPAESGKNPELLLSDMIFGSRVTYLNDEYMLHLNYLKDLTKEYENYNLIISDLIPPGMTLLAHTDSDAIIANGSSPSASFIISHQQFSYAFFEYLDRIVSQLTR
ncbi:hypothetical protein [Butyrivibrio sp. JL13D10]|uniref:hypothetical protein n=1 Tax=Butyrivibrio sp. JL13D10 TaxID=3236815 RepID=UPI0038B468DA